MEAIALNPADKEALFKREFLSPPPNKVATLTDVIYEGNVDGGPFLSLYFDSTVFFRVEQGADFRSLRITVFPEKKAKSCK